LAAVTVGGDLLLAHVVRVRKLCDEG
jgi:hypothetical protein